MGNAFGALFVWGFLSILYVFPTLHILASSRSHGGATLGWVLVNLFCPIIGWGIFLIVTEPEKQRLIQLRYQQSIRAHNRPVFIKDSSPREHAKSIADSLSTEINR